MNHPHQTTLGKHVVTANKDVMKGSDATKGVIMTHRSKESAIQEALSQMKNLDIVNEIGNMIRIEEWVI